MSFLTPLFLAALAGLAVPVLFHLIQRERRNVVQFPSLMFLRRIPYQSVRRRRIRHWLLLALRLAALAIVVTAFARPFLRRADVSAAGSTGAREVVVLLDRSYSMGYGDRWQRALSAARDIVSRINPSDKASIVLFSSGADVAVRATSDRGRLQAALAGVEPGAGVTRYAPALKVAGTILSESPLPRREAILITDFQRSAWQGAEGVRLPEGAVLTPLPVGDKTTSNLAVTPVTLQRSTFSNQQRVTVTAGVINHGDARASGVDLALEVDGRAIQTRRLDIEPNGSASVSFEPVTIAHPGTRASVRSGSDALSRDNVFHFALSPEQPISVIVAQRNGASASSLYLSRALAVGDAPRFEAIVRQADSISPEDLNRASVVILNNAPVAQTTAERLGHFVSRGGGLFVVLGDRAEWPGSADVLPAVPGVAVDRSSGAAARLAALEYGHPVFELFRAPRSGDFSGARFYGYRSVTPAAGAQVLARFDDGAPALLERRVGSGRTLMWTSTADLFWNDLAVKPVFLPFVHRIVRHLASYQEPAPWRTVGEVLEPSQQSSKVAAGRVVITPAGERVILDSEGPDVLELTEQGFYEVRTQANESQPGAVVASNVDLSESDMTGIDPQELVAGVMGRAVTSNPAVTNGVPTDEAQEGAQRIWWYMLFAGVLLLAAETIVGNRSTV